MTATIIPFPDRRALVAEAAATTAEARDRVDAVEAGLAAGDVAGGDEERGWADRAHRVLDLVESLLDDGGSPETVDLCERGLHCLGAAAGDIVDHELVVELAGRLRDLHVRACRQTPPDPESLADLIVWLSRRRPFGTSARWLDPYLPLLTPATRAALRRRRAAHQIPAPAHVARGNDQGRLAALDALLARAEHPSAI